MLWNWPTLNMCIITYEQFLSMLVFVAFELLSKLVSDTLLMLFIEVEHFPECVGFLHWVVRRLLLIKSFGMFNQFFDIDFILISVHHCQPINILLLNHDLPLFQYLNQFFGADPLLWGLLHQHLLHRLKDIFDQIDRQTFGRCQHCHKNIAAGWLSRNGD